MLKKIAHLLGMALLLVGCSGDTALKPFASDGCSLFPDSSVITQADWCSCCVEHDVTYWRGGTANQRKAADKQLKDCVLQKTDDKALATLMYEGVRVGGSPYFYNWYRWGYGWPYERKYQALTAEENEQADGLLQAYFESSKQKICPM